MKRNVIGLIFIFTIAILGIVCLTGCFNTGKSDVLLGIGVDCGNINFKYDADGYLGQYGKDNKPNLDYKVYAYYENNKTKELDTSEYKVTYRYTNLKGNKEQELDKLPQNYEFGFYYINIAYKDKKFSLYFKFDKETTIYRLITDKTTWKYGEDQPRLSVSSGISLGEFDITYKYVKTQTSTLVAPTENELQNKEYYPLSEEEKRLEPGYYFLFAEIADQEWYNEGRTNYVFVTVQKANLINSKNDNYPLGHQFHEFTYRFTNVLGNVNADEITLCELELKNEVNADMKYTVPVKIIATGDDDIFNCSNYNEYVFRDVKLDLSDELSKCYNEQIWFCNIKAEKGIVYIPHSLYIFDGLIFADTPVGYTNYWSAVSVIRDKGSQNETTLTLYDGNNIFENALPSGTYKYTLSLKDKDNFIWYNTRTSYETTEDIELTLIVS